MGYPVTSLVEMWEGRWTGRRVACSGLRAGVRVRLCGGHVERLHHRLRRVGQPGLRRQDRSPCSLEPGLRRRCRAAGGAPPPRVALGPLGRRAARPNRRRRRRPGPRLCRGFGGSQRPGAGEIAVSVLYAAGMLVLTLSWFEAFSAERGLRFALRCLFVRLPGPGRRVLRPLVSRRVGVVRRVLRAARRLACADAACARGCRGTPRRRVTFCPGGRRPRRALRFALLGAVMRALTGSFLCVFTLTAVGLLHTSVMGNDFEYVVGAIPMTEALAIATVLLALGVSSRAASPRRAPSIARCSPSCRGRRRLGIARRLRRDDHGGLLRPGRHGVRCFARGGVRRRCVPDGHLSGGDAALARGGALAGHRAQLPGPGRMPRMRRSSSSSAFTCCQWS